MIEGKYTSNRHRPSMNQKIHVGPMHVMIMIIMLWREVLRPTLVFGGGSTQGLCIRRPMCIYNDFICRTRWRYNRTAWAAIQVLTSTRTICIKAKQLTFLHPSTCDTSSKIMSSEATQPNIFVPLGYHRLQRSARMS